MNELNPRDKIRKQVINLLDTQPFFAYLILRMNINEEKGIPTIGVNGRGHLAYNPEFIATLNPYELRGVLMHEVMHVALSHFARAEPMHKEIFNIAADIVVNNIVIANHEILPQNPLTPYNDIVNIGDITIEDVSKKTVEEIYHQLLNNITESKEFSGFDSHEFSTEPEESNSNLKEEMKQAIIESALRAKQRGLMPAGIDNLIDKIINPKIDWKTKLLRYIVNSIPYDFSFSKPNKKFLSHGIILPGVIKEQLDIVIAVDTSGSIDKEMITTFLGEITGLCSAHANLHATILFCDAEIQEVVNVTPATAIDYSKLSFKGGGGTSHRGIVKYLQDNIPNCKILISLTDGFSDIESCYGELTCHKIILLDRDYNLSRLEPFGECIVVK